MSGTAHIEMTTAGTGIAEFTYRRMDKGQLQGLALSNVPIAIEYGSVHATVGVMRGGEGEEFTVAIFLNDYVSDEHKPAYNGIYNFTTEDILFLKLLTYEVRTIRLSASIYLDEREA